jgi:hypothetical protein
MRERSTDILILGGTTGGVAAALAVGRAGGRCVVVEPTDWIGGQLTAQAVPPDENEWIETVGGTEAYQRFRELVRRWYRDHRTLTEAARAAQRLNPGGGWVSRLCMEPTVGERVLRGMLAEHIAAGRVELLTEHEWVRAETSGDRVEGVAVRDLRSGEESVLRAKLYLDATDLGDLLGLGGVEHAVGAEAADTYVEMHGRTDLKRGEADPLDQQACSWCFAVEHRPGEDHTIDRPGTYGFWRSYVPEMTPRWPGPLFSWTVPSHNDEGQRTFRFVPWPDEPDPGEWEMWRYRRIVDRSIYSAESAEAQRVAIPPEVCLVNWVQMDYWRKPLLGVEGAARAEALSEARELSRCLLYWMQTEAPRHDGGTGYPGLRPRGEELGTADGLAKSVYVREPRRLLAKLVVTEAHVGTRQRREAGAPNQDATPFGAGEPFTDSVGIGHYQIDLHPSCAGRNSVYVPATPFRIPLRALVPVRVRNVLAAGKCLGVSHVANGAYRMHPVEWNAGESAGTLAAWCLTHGAEPHQVAEDVAMTERVQQALRGEGVRLSWPWE